MFALFQLSPIEILILLGGLLCLGLGAGLVGLVLYLVLRKRPEDQRD